MPVDGLSRAEIGAAYAWPDATAPFVRANFVTSLDGRITGPDGRSGSLGNDADRTVFAHLRSTADVIVVGAGTARAEGYRPVLPGEIDPTARAAEGRDGVPSIALVSRSLRADDDLLAGGAAPTYVMTSASHGRVPDALPADRLLVHGHDTVDLTAAIDDLAARGLRRILCEGGPSLLADLWSAGLVDELCLTHRSVIAGSGPTLVPEETAVPGVLEPRFVRRVEGAVLARYAVEHGAAVAE